MTPTAENVRRALEVALGGARSLRCRVARLGGGCFFCSKMKLVKHAILYT